MRDESETLIPAVDVFKAALDAVIVMDADGLVRDWNPAAERAFGYTREEVVGQDLADLIVPPTYRNAHRAAFRRYVETRQPTVMGQRLELTALCRDGSELPVELTVTLMDREPPLFVGFLRDLTHQVRGQNESQKLQQRMAFLAHAGLSLDISLDLDETLRRLVALTVPELAELAVIDLLSEDGSIRGAVAAAGTDPGRAADLETMRREHPLEISGPHPVAQVLRTGEAMLLPEMTPERLHDFAQGEEHYDLMMRLRYRSAIVVPLLSRSRMLGALSLLRMEDDVPYDEHDLLLVETLGRRAALTLENARLYNSTRHIARTLQQSLLPRVLPEIPGARLAARYRAAAEGQDVGGDFYDAFPTDNGRWGIAIGDVCGKGPEAAALTALARYTIRAVADRGVSGVLSVLNDAVLRDTVSGDRFLTALFGELSQVDDRLVLDFAIAGHPAPFLIHADGDVEQVQAHGPLIGVLPGAAYAPHRVELDVGDKLVLYTDGLTDARAPRVVLSEDDIAGLLREANGLDGQALAEFLELRATADSEARDDIAIVVLEAVGAGASALSVHFYAATS